MLNTENEDNNPRLQKILAAAGVASRRASEILILAGRVSVNGKTVTELGSRVNIENDVVRVDGVIVQLDVDKKYYVLNKPVGVVSTMADEKERKDLSFYVDNLPVRVVNVGRLDRDTSGLLILTNDGELANRLAHPKYGVEKTYVAKLHGPITAQKLQMLKDGVELEDGVSRADRVKLISVDQDGRFSLVEITLHSGKNRIVRRMFDAVGHPVENLVRRQFGPLGLGSLKIGELRELSKAERSALLTVTSDGPNIKKVTAGRPGDGAGARGLRGIAADKPARPVRKVTSKRSNKSKKRAKPND